jgi:hypothetical protein
MKTFTTEQILAMIDEVVELAPAPMFEVVGEFIYNEEDAA